MRKSFDVLKMVLDSSHKKNNNYCIETVMALRVAAAAVFFLFS